jgi:hypothetical protein
VVDSRCSVAPASHFVPVWQPDPGGVTPVAFVTQLLFWWDQGMGAGRELGCTAGVTDSVRHGAAVSKSGSAIGSAAMGVAFVEVEGRVELVLACQQFLPPRLVLEGPLAL